MDVLTIDEYGIIKENKTFKGFNDSKRRLDRSQYFKMIEGKKICALFAKSREKPFNSGKIIPTKMRFCNGCNDKRMCYKCNNRVNENKEFEANSNLLKRQTSTNLVICFKETNDLFVIVHLL